MDAADGDEKRKAARIMIERMMGTSFADAMEAAADSGGFGADVARLAMEHAFADVWARPGLALRDRSLVVIATLVAQGQPAELKNHIRIALNIGLTAAEIEEALIQTLPYVGFPAISTALAAAIEVMRERGIDTRTLKAGERGLL